MLSLAGGGRIDRNVLAAYCGSGGCRADMGKGIKRADAQEAAREREAENENNKHFKFKGRSSKNLYSGKYGV